MSWLMGVRFHVDWSRPRVSIIEYDDYGKHTEASDVRKASSEALQKLGVQKHHMSSEILGLGPLM